jgi:hypothetical protein
MRWRQENPRNTFDRGLSWPQSRSGRDDKEKNPCPTENRTSVVDPSKESFMRKENLFHPAISLYEFPFGTEDDVTILDTFILLYCL